MGTCAVLIAHGRWALVTFSGTPRARAPGRWPIATIPAIGNRRRTLAMVVVIMAVVITAPPRRRMDHIGGTAVIPVEAGPISIATVAGAISAVSIAVGTAVAAVIAARVGIPVAGTAAVVATGCAATDLIIGRAAAQPRQGNGGKQETFHGGPPGPHRCMDASLGAGH